MHSKQSSLSQNPYTELQGGTPNNGLQGDAPRAARA
jgi:hypothetical protein